MQIQHLFELPQHVPLVAGWIYDEFWAGQGRLTRETIAGSLRQAASAEAIPLSLLALESGRPVGTINLIENDDDQRPHLRPWLAALFVLPVLRRRGIGSALVRTLQQESARLGIPSMYLGTDNPVFYLRLGATLHEQVTREFCILRLDSSRERDHAAS